MGSFRQRDERLDLADVAELTLGADATTAAFLRGRGVVIPCTAVAEKVDRSRNLAPGSDDEIALRAASAAAVISIAESVAQRTGQEVTPAMIARYLELSVKEAHHKRQRMDEEEEDARITEVTETSPPVDVPLHRCLDTAHY